MNKSNSKLDGYFKKSRNWKEELTKLRGILLDCGLTEELKWGKPCYTFQESNLFLLLPLKGTCSLLVCKGALLKDPKGILIKPGENSQSARQIRFTNVQEISKLKSTLKSYILEAIAAERAGLKIEFKKSSDLIYPVEFQSKLREMPALTTAFQALTPGRQRAYNIFFTGAKQSKTREARVEKCVMDILKGKGLND